MYQLVHPKHGETCVYTEVALSRHEAAGWQIKEPQEKVTEVPQDPVIKRRKRRNDDSK